jgi:YihY family inner membrane protein
MEPQSGISGGATAAAPAPESAPELEQIATTYLVQPWRTMLREHGLSTLRYLTHTEAHTFAFSVAANAILSFVPFIVVMSWLIRGLFHSRLMFDVMKQLVIDHLPAGQHVVAAILSNTGGHVKIASVFLLLITSSGVFLPLEVAFNRIWGFPKNRSYLSNQLVSLGLAFACGLLALISTALAAGNEYALQSLMLGHTQNLLFAVAFLFVRKVLSVVTAIAIFFLIYWILPNGKVSARTAFAAAFAIGVLWELAQYIYVLVLPLLKFPEVYAGFSASATLMFWAFITGLMVLAGASLAATPPAGQEVNE